MHPTVSPGTGDILQLIKDGKVVYTFDLPPSALVINAGTITLDRNNSVLAGNNSITINSGGVLDVHMMVNRPEQQIAEFVLEIGHVATLDRVGDLIGFLDRIRCNRLEGLDGVPFAAADRIAEPRHDRNEALYHERGLPRFDPSLSSIIYIM